MQIADSQWLPIEIGNDLKAGKYVSYAKINGKLAYQHVFDQPITDLGDVFHHVGSLFADYPPSPFITIKNYVYSAFNNPVASNEACHDHADNKCEGNPYGWSEWSTCSQSDHISLGFQTSTRSVCICSTVCEGYNLAAFEIRRQTCNHQVAQPTKIKIELGHSTDAQKFAQKDIKLSKIEKCAGIGCGKIHLATLTDACEDGWNLMIVGNRIECLKVVHKQTGDSIEIDATNAITKCHEEDIQARFDSFEIS